MICLVAALKGLHAVLQTYLESKVAGVEWAGVDDQVCNTVMLQQHSLSKLWAGWLHL
jgi:hypothetical protein